MKEIILGVVVVLMLLASSCSLTGAPVNIPKNTYSQPVPTIPMGQEPPKEMPWISPGKVQIGNFYPGATAEWNIIVHNGYSPAETTYTVTTDVMDTEAYLPLLKTLKDRDTRNIISIVSSYSGDTLSVKEYNSVKNEIEVVGLQSGQKRTITVVYEHSSTSTYSIYYKEPSYVAEGYSMPPEDAKDWVIVADPSPVLAPFETKDILVSVVMPTGATAPSKWEFWIGVSESAGSMVQTELCSRWQVTMR